MAYSRFLRIAVISCLVAPARVAAQTCELTDLGTLGQSWSRAQGMNKAGMVVGGSPPAGDMSPGPLVWRDGRMRALPTPDGHGTATGIDSTGKRIVGELPGARAALWTDGVLMPLPTNEGFTSSAAPVRLNNGKTAALDGRGSLFRVLFRTLLVSLQDTIREIFQVRFLSELPHALAGNVGAGVCERTPLQTGEDRAFDLRNTLSLRSSGATMCRRMSIFGCSASRSAMRRRPE
jgi:uncharacterized membrane protein